MKKEYRMFRFLRTPKLAIGICILSLILIGTLFYILFSSSSPYETSLIHKNLSPSYSHFLGTDELGRDLAARIAQGIMISCSIGAIAFCIDMTLGVAWGTLAALTSPSILSHFLNKVSEVLYSLPYLLVVILISVFSGTGMIPLIAAMLLMGWIQTARITEILVKDALSSEYVLAAHVLGVSKTRIIIRHIMPNICAPIIASGLMSIPHAIFAEAFLSFLGVGIQPPKASLGSLISDALPALRFYPWRLVFPAATISFLILSVTFIADSILEITDPKLQKLRSAQNAKSDVLEGMPYET